MSVEHPHSFERRHSSGVLQQRDSRQKATQDGENIHVIASRVEEWLSASSHGDQPEQPEALDSKPRRWDVVNPSATRIGHADDVVEDVDGRLRALHEERRAAMQGNTERQQQLDVARITQALCNSLDLTGWERDRVLGVVCELDATAFGSQRTIPSVVLVVARRVVDTKRRTWLGLEDDGWLDDQPPERLRERSERLHELTDSDQYERLLESCALTAEGVQTLETMLDAELDDETVSEAVFGRSPVRDPALPSFEQYVSGAD